MELLRFFAKKRCKNCLYLIIIGVAWIFPGSAPFSSKILTTFFVFLVVALKTQAITARLTTPTLQISPPSKNVLKNLALALPGRVHLQISPVNYAQKNFSALGVHVHPVHP